MRNAFIAYEKLNDWQAHYINHLLSAHHALMAGLLDDAGQFRSGGVGIYRGKELVHMAPPANRVPVLMQQLLDWLKTTDLHPLIASCIFHYEFEFIHPFADGNGRTARALFYWSMAQNGYWLMEYTSISHILRKAPGCLVIDKHEDGGYVTVWTSESQDGWGYGIYGQRYDAAGVAEGDEVLAVHRALELRIEHRGGRADDFVFLVFGRMFDDDMEHEAVELRLR